MKAAAVLVDPVDDLVPDELGRRAVAGQHRSVGPGGGRAPRADGSRWSASVRPVPAQWSSPVRYVECDQQGVVFNAHYLTWADEASNAWWAARGLPWDALVARGAEYVVKASTLDWTSSAR